jgi:hypothetical protein
MPIIVIIKNRSYIISDIFVMTMSYLIGVSICATCLKIRRKQIDKMGKDKKVNSLRGGGSKLELSSDDELSMLILHCIEDNENYLVLNPKIKQFIFKIVRKEIKNELVAITSNMIQFLALRTLAEEKSMVAQIRNIVFLCQNKAQLIARVIGAILIGIFSIMFSLTSYVLIWLILLHSETQNLGVNCDSHFEKLESTEPVAIYVDSSRGNLSITVNDSARQVTIYVPSKSDEIIIDEVTGERVVQKYYQRSSTKAKQVLFSDFCKTDRVLKLFHELEELETLKESGSINYLDEFFE